MELLYSQFSGDRCHSFRRLLVGHPPSLLQELNRLLPFARPHQSIQSHLPFGIDPRSGGVEPFHTDLPVRDATGQNPPLVVRVVSLLVLDEKTHYPDDQRRILTCGIPDGKVRVEWLNAAAPGVDAKWEMRLYGLVRTGEREKAIRFLQETRGMSHKEAAKRVARIAVELGMK